MKLELSWVISITLIGIVTICLVASLFGLGNGQITERENHSIFNMTLVEDDGESFTYNRSSRVFSTEKGDISWQTDNPQYIMIVTDSGFIEPNGNGIKIDPVTGNRVGFMIEGNIWEGYKTGNVLTITDETSFTVQLEFNDFLIWPCVKGELSAFSASTDHKFLYFSEHSDIYGVSNFGVITIGIHGDVAYINGDSTLSKVKYNSVISNKLESLNYSILATQIMTESNEEYYVQEIIVPSILTIDNQSDGYFKFWVIVSFAVITILGICFALQIRWTPKVQ